MTDNKNTEKVQGFFVSLITNPVLYAGLGAGIIIGFVAGFCLGKFG